MGNSLVTPLKRGVVHLYKIYEDPFPHVRRDYRGTLPLTKSNGLYDRHTNKNNVIIILERV